MTRPTEELSAGEWAVLALLAEKPGHGFAVARAMDPAGEIGKVWSMRRPLVYRAIDRLIEIGFARPIGTIASRSGPRRTVLQAAPAGKQALTKWLLQPVGHVRDARSLLLLKLLFLDRRQQDHAQLLHAQRREFQALVDHLATAVAEAHGFDQTLLRWRLENTAAAIRFIDAITEEPVTAPGEHLR